METLDVVITEVETDDVLDAIVKLIGQLNKTGKTRAWPVHGGDTVVFLDGAEIAFENLRAGEYGLEYDDSWACLSLFPGKNGLWAHLGNGLSLPDSLQEKILKKLHEQPKLIIPAKRARVAPLAWITSLVEDNKINKAYKGEF